MNIRDFSQCALGKWCIASRPVTCLSTLPHLAVEWISRYSSIPFSIEPRHRKWLLQLFEWTVCPRAFLNRLLCARCWHQATHSMRVHWRLVSLRFASPRRAIRLDCLRWWLQEGEIDWRIECQKKLESVIQRASSVEYSRLEEKKNNKR